MTKAETKPTEESKMADTIENPINTEETKAPELSREEVLEIQLAELNDKHLRLFSDFDNYRKRMIKEKAEWIKTASEKLVIELLPVIDDFERALEALQEESEEEKAQKKGIELIYHKLVKVLQQQGVEAFNPLHQSFDPDFHEAIAQTPTEDAELKGKVVDVIEKGYKMHEKVSRYAKVVVGI